MTVVKRFNLFAPITIAPVMSRLTQRLCDAAESGSLNEIKVCLSGVSSPFDILQRLVLVKKVPVNSVGSHLDRTPLHLAASKGHSDICLFLLENKADPSIRDCQSDPKHIRKWRPLDYAIWNGNTDTVLAILAHSPNQDLLQGDWRWPPLTYAAYLGHTSVVKALLDTALQRNLPVHLLLAKRDTQEYKTVLDHTQRPEVAELLLRSGAKLELCTKQKQKEWRPILDKILAEKAKQ